MRIGVILPAKSYSAKTFTNTRLLIVVKGLPGYLKRIRYAFGQPEVKISGATFNLSVINTIDPDQLSCLLLLESF
jgi:hypothetical protein